MSDACCVMFAVCVVCCVLLVFCCLLGVAFDDCCALTFFVLSIALCLLFVGVVVLFVVSFLKSMQRLLCVMFD